MKISLSFLYWLLLVAILITGIKTICNALEDNGIAYDNATRSISASQMKGVFVCPVRPSPDSLNWKGTRIAFKEAWLEREVKTVHSYIWFGYLKPSGRYMLCFTLKEGNEAFNPLKSTSSPFFVIKDHGESFGTYNFNELFEDEINSEIFLQHGVQMSLISSWNEPRDDTLQLTW